MTFSKFSSVSSKIPWKFKSALKIQSQEPQHTNDLRQKWKSLSHVPLFETPWAVRGILQARILEWVAFPFFREPSQPRDQTQLPHIAGRFFTSWATREALT